MRPNLTLNFGVRYDVEFPPQFKPPLGLARPHTICWDCRRASRPTRTISSRASDLACDPKGDGKTVIRASYGMFYDHPLLGLYFLGDASDGSTSGQLAFGGTGLCEWARETRPISMRFRFFRVRSTPPTARPRHSRSPTPTLGYLPDQQQFQAFNFPQSTFLNQNYLNLNLANPGASTFLPLGFPALRLSAGQELRVRLLAAGQPDHRARSWRRASRSAWPTTLTADVI